MASNTELASSPTSAASRLLGLAACGQSVWLDYIGAALIDSGGLTRLIESDGLAGVTSNPAIFERAINGSGDYNEILGLMKGTGVDPKIAYEALAITDIQNAADCFLPIYQESAGRDGYVSLEVDPALAHDRDGTLAEARRLWKQVARPNLMVKVPATDAGIAAIETLIVEGINVNVTLLFAREAYERVAEAFLCGLEKRLAAGGRVRGIASVASFFVSRIDAAVEAAIDARTDRDALSALRGRVAIANAKLAYRHFTELIASERWAALEAAGALPQRLLWASTGTKNPRHRDVLYVEELIGPYTVNTLPPATLDAFREHGVAQPTLAAGCEEARAILEQLARAGIDLRSITDRLLDDGVKLFCDAFTKLLSAVATKTR